MKHLKILIFILLFFNFKISAQNSKEEQKIIAKIDKQILDNNIEKIEKGLSDKVLIYLKANTPILIQLEHYELIRYYYTTGEESDVMELVNKTKLYVENWKKNKYIIVGQEDYKLNQKEIEHLIKEKSLKK